MHGSFSRIGGNSAPPFASLNVSFDVGDDPLSVNSNCLLIQKTLEIPHLVQSKQCHGADIHIVDNIKEPIPSCDALITAKKGIGLMIKHADCQAALFYDPEAKVIAAVHAGWRGLGQKIYTKTIETLKTDFHCSPENLLVAISPSLGMAEFKNYQQELPQEFWKYQERPLHFNLWDIAEDELIQAGVRVKNIEMAMICTQSNPQEYFSYRREKVTGRMGTVICLR